MNATPPSGWYPDAKIPGQQRWWDGSQWTDHVHVPATPPPPPGTAPGPAATPAPTSPAATPGPATEPAPPVAFPGSTSDAPTAAVAAVTGWMKAHKILTGILAFLVLLVILGLIGGGSEPPAPADATTGAAPAPDASPDPAPTAAPSTTAKASPTPTPSPTAKPTPKPTPTNPYGPQPPQEAQFIKLAKTAMSDYENASNDLKAGAALSTRNRNLCQLLGAGQVAGWTGTVTTLDSNGDGYGIVTIEIAPNMELGTWNNAFSDVTDNTLIKPGPLFDKVINLEEGQNVRFAGAFRPDAGTCVNDSRLTQAGKVEDPSFIFRFADVTKVP